MVCPLECCLLSAVHISPSRCIVVKVFPPGGHALLVNITLAECVLRRRVPDSHSLCWLFLPTPPCICSYGFCPAPCLGRLTPQGLHLGSLADLHHVGLGQWEAEEGEWKVRGEETRSFVPLFSCFSMTLVVTAALGVCGSCWWSRQHNLLTRLSALPFQPRGVHGWACSPASLICH